MLKAMIVAGVLSLSSGAAHPAHANGSGESAQARAPHTDTGVVDALIRRDLARERLSNGRPPITTREGLAAFMRVAEPGHPLHRLSFTAKKRFLKSLTFNENGLTGYRADDLLAELSASEIYQVLSLLGAQHSAPFLGEARVVDDLDRATVQSFGFGGDLCDQQGPVGGATCSDDIYDAKCVSRATCEEHHLGFICRSTC